jgi:outer membrane lipoprotein-sorting protein
VSFLRRASTSRLVAVLTAAVVLAAGGVALAQAVAGGGPVPPRRSLPVAVRDALAAPAVPGVSGRISFTNRLIGLSGVEGATPLLTGASGRVWAAPERRLRLELQSDRGDVLLVSDGQTFTLYDGSARTAYRGRLPAARHHGGAAVPTLATIRQAIGRFERHATVSGPRPSSLAGEPAYTVRVSPRPRAGLLGAVELAWDASHGVPLRLAAYARGESRPVLELQATDVSFGPVASSVFSFTPPPGTRMVEVASGERTGATGTASRRRSPTGISAVRRRLPFALRAPARLAGMTLTGAHGLGRGARSGALLVYGHDLGGFAVLEKPAADARSDSAGGGQLRQTRVQVGDVAGQAIATPLGSLVRFSRGGVEYTVVGLVAKSVALSAARGL